MLSGNGAVNPDFYFYNLGHQKIFIFTIEKIIINLCAEIVLPIGERQTGCTERHPRSHEHLLGQRSDQGDGMISSQGRVDQQIMRTCICI